MERHELALRDRTVFLFSSGPIGDPPRPLEDPAEVASIDEATMALDHRVFAGRLTESELGAGERLIIKMVRAPFGDFRSWDDITDWATAIASFVNGEEDGALARSSPPEPIDRASRSPPEQVEGDADQERRASDHGDPLADGRGR